MLARSFTRLVSIANIACLEQELESVFYRKNGIVNHLLTLHKKARKFIKCQTHTIKSRV